MFSRCLKPNQAEYEVEPSQHGRCIGHEGPGLVLTKIKSLRRELIYSEQMNLGQTLGFMHYSVTQEVLSPGFFFF